MSEPRTNRLLAALDRRDRVQLHNAGQQIALTRYDVLCEPGEKPNMVVFPDAGIISLITVFRDGATLEMATIGREGCSGLGATVTQTPALARAMVQADGTGLEIKPSILRDAIDSMPALRTLLMAYSEALLSQVLVSGGCNAAHNVEQRLARWLLMTADRFDDPRLPLTQELLSEMLGVRRASVTVALQSLKRKGAIMTERGAIEIADRGKLEACSCECYDAIRSGYQLLLPTTYL